MLNYDVDGKITTLTTIERRLFHFALWRWCAVSGRGKDDWPGWALFHYASKEHLLRCFLCRYQSAIACGGDRDTCAHLCLGGLYKRYHRALHRLNSCPGSWIRKRANYNACMAIATTPFKEKTVYSARAFADVQNSLRPLYLIYKSKRALGGGI